MPAQGNPRRGTRLNIRDLRSDALHRLLLSPRGRVATVEEVPRLSDLFSWPSLLVQVAIADLVHDGRLAEDEQGRLIVRKVAP